MLASPTLMSFMLSANDYDLALIIIKFKNVGGNAGFDINNTVLYSFSGMHAVKPQGLWGCKYHLHINGSLTDAFLQ